MAFRLGTVPYLNARPLTTGLSKEHDVIESVPSVLAGQLQAGELDAALVPIVSYFENWNHTWLYPDVCIGADGPVLTVRLLHDRPLDTLSRVAPDPNSRTSNILLRLLLETHVGIAPHYVERPAHASSREELLSDTDAALVIGDPAFALSETPGTDLAAAWKEWTGLPFVFAAWVVHERAVDRAEELKEALRQGADLPIEELIASADEASVDVVRTYLTRNLRYPFDEAARDGLRLFWERAAEADLVPPARELRFLR
jgi:predicted solute-binding protein